MTKLREHMSRRRARQRWLGVAGVFLLVATAGFYGWWFAFRPVVDEMLPFVGTWRLESPVFPAQPDLFFELDLMLDGTMRDRILDRQTRVVEYEQLRPGRWRVADGRFQEVIGGNHLLDLLAGGGRTSLVYDHLVTWEGQDRFRLDGTSRKNQIWSRCDRSGNR